MVNTFSFCEKVGENIITLSSAEFVQRVAKVKIHIYKTRLKDYTNILTLKVQCKICSERQSLFFFYFIFFS